MRSYCNYIGMLGLLVLAGCGGDDSGDITNPPGEGITLTVTGEGSGSGQVTAAATPALDCTLTAGSPTGTCSASYTLNSTVTLTAAPATGSSFSGWSGDAADCGTALSCTVTMDQSRSAIAGFTSSASPQGVEITSSAWYPDPDFADEGAIQWAVEVRNTTAQVVDLARIDFTSHDAAGTVLATDFSFAGPIPPGETRAAEGLAEYLGTEATVDIKVTDVQFGTTDPGLGAAQIVSSNWRADPSFAGEGAVIWTVEVQNTSTQIMETVRVDFVTYNASGQILDYDFTFVGPIAPGATGAAEGQADLRGGEATVNFQVSEVTYTEESE